MMARCRRKPPGTGLLAWTLSQTAMQSPALRLDLIDAARAAGLIRPDKRGLTSLASVLKRLRAKGCVAFDDETVQWTGRALPVTAIGKPARARFRRIAAGDPALFERLRLAELARLQAARDAALAALRPSYALPFFPAAPQAWTPRRKVELSPSMRSTLAAYIVSRAARAVATQFREP